MTESNFLSGLLRYLSEDIFYNLQWLDWRALVIAVPAIILVFLIMNRLVQGATEEEPVTEIQEHPHIVGARLVKSKQHQEESTETKNDHQTDVHERLGKQRNRDEATEQLERLNRKTQQLELRVSRQEQIEAQLDQKVVELTACNEQLLEEVVESKQIQTKLHQEIAELTADNEQLHQEANDTRNAENYLKQQLAESQATNDQLESKAAENKYVEQALKLTTRVKTAEVTRHIDGMLSESPEQARGSNQSEEPLDTKTLHAISDLIRRIQGHSGQN